MTDKDETSPEWSEKAQNEKCRPASKVALMGFDAGDLMVISSFLYGCTLKYSDILWQKNRKQFILVGNRYPWEVTEFSEKDSILTLQDPPFVPVGFHFETVLSVQENNIPHNDDQPLTLRAILHNQIDNQAEITLIFQDNKMIRLMCEVLQIKLHDL